MTTIYEVAAHAGVSPATVSRVLNGNRAVAADLAERVRESIETLGYRPSRVARSMRTQRTMTVAVIVPDIENPFFTSVVRGIEAEARGRGLMTVLCNTDGDEDQELAYLELVVDQRLDGLILASSRASLGDFQRGDGCVVPTVLVDREVEQIDVDTVLVDNVLGARSATSHLLESGAQRVACITGPAAATTSRQRLEGYLQALEQAGRARDSALVYEGDFRVAGGRAGVAALMSGPEHPDALLVCNNQMTLGALQELADRRIELPDQMLVVGFDDEPWARYWRPAVSTVAQPAGDVGRTAMRLLVDRLEGDTDRASRHVRLTPALTVRGTSQR